MCNGDECQRERHRRACAAWRERNPDYDREDRLRRRLVVEALEAPADGPAPADPMARLDWRVARDVVGLEVAVVVEEFGQVLVKWARDVVSPQMPASKGFSGQVAPSVARDGIAVRAPP